MPSFSQFKEDLIIDKYINNNNLKEIISPFVVEIGCAYPEILSNSRYFIGLGWKGLVIDANKKFYDLQKNYHQNNPNVTVIKCLVADKDGTAQYDEQEEETISGIGQKGELMETKTLSTLLNENQLPKEIGILSIDVEGYDNQVLKNIFAEEIKPQIIIIEANSKQDRLNHIAVLENEYKKFEETGRGFLQFGNSGHYLNHIVNKALKFNLFNGVNSLWIRKDLIK
jgi:FkbM family methyltransferase